jgi:hypothetical protein
LIQPERLIDWILLRDSPAISLNARERDVGPERPFIRLAKGA